MKYLIVAILIMGTAWAKTCRYTDGSPQLLQMSECGIQYCQASIMCDDELVNTVCKATNGKCPPMAILCMGGEVKVTSAATFRADAVLENRKNLVAKLNATLPYTIDKDKIDASKLEAAIDMMAYLFNKVNPQFEKEAMKRALQEVVAKHGIKDGFLPVAAEAAMRAYHMGFSAVGDMITPAIAQLNPEMGKVFQQEVGSPASYGSDYIMGFDMNQVPGMQTAMDKVFANSGANGPLAGIQTPGDGIFGLDDSFKAMFTGMTQEDMAAQFSGIQFGDSDERFGGFSGADPEMYENGYDPQLAIDNDGWREPSGAEPAIKSTALAHQTAKALGYVAAAAALSGVGALPAGIVGFVGGTIEIFAEVVDSIGSGATTSGATTSGATTSGGTTGGGTTGGGATGGGTTGGGATGGGTTGGGATGGGTTGGGTTGGGTTDGGTTDGGTTDGGTTDGGTTDGGTTDGGTTSGGTTTDDNHKKTMGDPDKLEGGKTPPPGFKSPDQNDNDTPLILTNPDNENGENGGVLAKKLKAKNPGTIDPNEEDEHEGYIEISQEKLKELEENSKHGGNLTDPSAGAGSASY